MAIGKSDFVFLVLTLYRTVISQPVVENKPFYENDVTLSSIEEIVERYNFQVMDKLESEMRKGFQDLRRELELERNRRHDLEKKMEKCFSEIIEIESAGNVKTTTNPAPTTTTPVNETVDCPDGLSEFAEHCYMFETNKLKWGDAEQSCQDHGAYLVSVNTQAEQDFLVDLIKSNYTTDETDYFWLGLTLLAGKKVWADGTDVNYTQWADNNPDCMKTHGCKAYISEYSDFSWEDADSDYRFFSVCEQEKTQLGDFAMSIVPACPLRFVRFEGHCYLFEMKKKSWRKAESACRSRGAYLASVNTQSEQEFLVTQIKDHFSSYETTYWLGMSLMTGKTVWADGTDVNYTQWGPKQPNCMMKGCKVFMSEYYNYEWEDAHSSMYSFYICELELDI